jgi:hypothetical protein
VSATAALVKINIPEGIRNGVARGAIESGPSWVALDPHKSQKRVEVFVMERVRQPLAAVLGVVRELVVVQLPDLLLETFNPSSQRETGTSAEGLKQISLFKAF